ncbi:extensin-like domain-containing protein [Segnochrobactrum spirostomi]|uniref:extensin-like domain-containing protein n=1 Tax=Segnochrobactrum spirostomi TaxID=2608987 RepID=UPI001AD83CB9|nr:extensin family protein [Segnochrobactrum spirostomi]
MPQGQVTGPAPTTLILPPLPDAPHQGKSAKGDRTAPKPSASSLAAAPDPAQAAAMAAAKAALATELGRRFGALPGFAAEGYAPSGVALIPPPDVAAGNAAAAAAGAGGAPGTQPGAAGSGGPGAAASDAAEGGVARVGSGAVPGAAGPNGATGLAGPVAVPAPKPGVRTASLTTTGPDAAATATGLGGAGLAGSAATGSGSAGAIGGPVALPRPDPRPATTASAAAAAPPAADTSEDAPDAGATFLGLALPARKPVMTANASATAADDDDDSPADLEGKPAPGQRLSLPEPRPEPDTEAANPVMLASINPKGATSPKDWNTPSVPRPLSSKVPPYAAPPLVESTLGLAPACAALVRRGLAEMKFDPDLPKAGACGVTEATKLSAFRAPDGHVVTLDPPAEVRCEVAVAVVNWMRDDMSGAVAKLGAPLQSVKIADSYSCRPRNRVRGAKLSEHAKGGAVDVSGFVLADGRTFTTKGHDLPMAFRVTMRDTACARFMTVLGPGSDGYHENHIHVDLEHRTRVSTYCHWVIDDAPVALRGTKVRRVRL